MKWFRMYSEARTDAKLRTLPAEQFRVWFNLLCFAAEQEQARGEIIGYDAELLAVEVADGDTDLLQQTLARLAKLRIVCCDDERIRFLNFEKRQYDKPSDQPARVAERVRHHRARTREMRNAPVTPRNAPYSERESDTDTEADSPSVSGGVDSTERENRVREASEPSAPAAPTPVTPSSLSPSPRPIAQTQSQSQSQSQKSSKPAASSQRQPPLPDAREPPPRIDSELWTALLDGMGHSPVTRAERVGWGNWLAQLQEARASPDEIRKRCVQYRRCYGPEIPLTPKSLVEHWSEFDGQLATTATGQAASATLQALDVAANRRRAEEQQMADEKRRLAAQYLGDLPTTHGLRRQPAAG